MIPSLANNQTIMIHKTFNIFCLSFRLEEGDNATRTQAVIASESESERENKEGG